MIQWSSDPVIQFLSEQHSTSLWLKCYVHLSASHPCSSFHRPDWYKCVCQDNIQLHPIQFCSLHSQDMNESSQMFIHIFHKYTVIHLFWEQICVLFHHVGWLIMPLFQMRKSSGTISLCILGQQEGTKDLIAQLSDFAVHSQNASMPILDWKRI